MTTGPQRLFLLVLSQSIVLYAGADHSIGYERV